jgi:hypothetical protein
LSDGPQAFWCHQKKTVLADFKANHAPLPSPYHLQINDLSQPPLEDQTDGYPEVYGLGCMLVERKLEI